MGHSKPSGMNKAVEMVKQLREQEKSFLATAQGYKLQALFTAFDIGEVISDIVIGQYGKGKMEEFSQLCGFSLKTGYNYLYLFRAASDKLILKEHSDLPSNFWYILGSADVTRQYDVFGDMLHSRLLQSPPWRYLSDSEPNPDGSDKRQVIDFAKLTDVCKLVNTLRGQLEQAEIYYPFQKYNLYIGNAPTNEAEATELVQCEPIRASFTQQKYRTEYTFIAGQMKGAEGASVDIVYMISFDKGDEVKYEEGLRKSSLMFDTISQFVGWPVPLGLTILGKEKETEALIQANRLSPDKYNQGFRAFHWANKKLVENLEIRNDALCSGDSGVLAVEKKAIYGKCEEILKGSDFMEGMIDVVITDPPYGKYEPWRPGTKVDFHDISTPQMAADLVGRVARTLVKRRLIKERFAWMSFCPVDLISVFEPAVLSAFKRLDYKYHVIIWDKEAVGPVGSNQSVARQAEAILYVSVGRPLNTITEDGKTLDLHPNILRYRVQSKVGENDFWKPVDLIERLVRMTTGEDQAEGAKRQLILDPFAGKGTTGVACIRCNRDFRLIESHKGQFTAAVDNLIRAAAKAAE